MLRFSRRAAAARKPFDTRASADDIRACFRLILGRDPNPEEWPGHSMRAGEDLAGVVASYVNSLEFSNRGLQRPGQASVTLTELPGFRIYTADDDASVGLHVRAGNYEHDVSRIFQDVLRPGMGVIDLGANIGYFSMLAASIVGAHGYVLAVEPNPRNARLLEASRRANGFAHVTIAQTAAGAVTGLLVLHTSHSNGTTSAPPEEAARLFASETVCCVRADALVAEGRRIDLIKADVEGAEYLALQGCAQVIARDRPIIVTEFSPGMLQGISGVSGEAYLDWLIARGYRLAVIQPDGSRAAGDVTAVMAAYVARGTDHIDLIATPA